MAIHQLHCFKAGILYDDGEPRNTFHGLRPTHAKILNLVMCINLESC